ncbi:MULTISPECIES: hypothetical protein [unclassified Streptomyces]|uniref:hypothetical protein n=1 Tax=unclassified Streptomyces TaxID=2593676 RepID=UPI0024A94C0E|nr:MULTISPECIES: hypothetical protein [unclassified Streptomyces]MDX3339681.1 hypothetical protein [Streptomyces sp. ME02-6979.5a]
MHILVPEDPVFMTRFLEMEEPLFHSLYYLHLNHLPEDQAEKIRRAYDSWGYIQAAMPTHLSWHTPTAFEIAAARRDSKGYRLYGPDGEQLISMYPVEVSVESLSSLTECLRLLEVAELELSGPLAGALHEIRDPGQDRELVDNYRRVLKALQLTAPPALLTELRNAAPEVTLNGPLYAEYADYRDRFCHALSTGDGFLYAMHRSMYL